MDIDTKLTWSATSDRQLGLESYIGLGALSQPGRVRDEEQLLYFTADTHLLRWDLNAGVGRGYGGSSDR